MPDTRPMGAVVARLRRTVIAAVLAVGFGLALAACVPEPVAVPVTPSPTRTAPVAPEPAESDAASEITTFVSVVDGDTIRTGAGTIRIVGIDTPETGQCGHDEASMTIGRLFAPGAPVTLVRTPGQNDTDAYGRLLRTVLTEDGVDLGLVQIEAGHAVARYDSQDGYPAHPNEAAYRAAQRATLNAEGEVVTVGCAGAGAPDATPGPHATAPNTTAPATPVPVAPEGTTDSASDDAAAPWWQTYSSCSKLKKNTAGHPTGPFSRDDPAEAEIYDWFAYGTGNRGDGDGDGLACE